jgi:hypothetical protein
MGQFKPMVKMYTTEPTVELKLKKGGHVKMPGKAVKKMNGGTMGALAAAPSARVPAVAPYGRAPARPSMAARRRAMMGRRGMAAPVMAKKGGEMESKAEHAKEMREMKGMEKKLEKHKSMPASKAHKGLKTGGVVKGQGGYKTGGVVKGQGGYKKGGSVKKFAKGGQVQDDGRPMQMPQGKKPPSAPVSISRLSGTFKKGGAVKKAEGGLSGRGPTDRDKMIKLEKESITTNVDDSMPTPEEMKRLRETYDRQLKNEQKGSENFMKNLRLRKKGGCA